MLQLVTPLWHALPAHEIVTGTDLVPAVIGPALDVVALVPVWAVVRPDSVAAGAFVIDG